MSSPAERGRPFSVIPVKTGIQDSVRMPKSPTSLDSRFHGNDGGHHARTVAFLEGRLRGSDRRSQWDAVDAVQ